MRRLPQLLCIPPLALLCLSGCATFDSPSYRPAAPAVVQSVTPLNTTAAADAPAMASIQADGSLSTDPSTQTSALYVPAPVDAVPAIQEPAPDQTGPRTPLPVTDIWTRMRNGFQLSRDRPEIREWAQRYANEGERTNRILQRSETYLCHVVDAVDERRMPLDLALLPAIESAFDPQAYSRSDAMGLWQFLPYTGTRFGLRQNWWYDGRRDVPEATRAALQYLDYLHNMFGDWLLAIAAYNTGEGRVKKALDEAVARGGKTDFWSLSLPAETRDYVPKLLGMVELVDHPELYGYELPPMANEPRIETVQLPGQIDMALAARMAGISLTELQGLNPGFRRWATAPDGPHRLVVPYGLGKSLRVAMAQLPKDKLVRWESHVVRQGESLHSISSQYAADPSALSQINRLEGHAIHVGTRLRIPVGSNYFVSREPASRYADDSDQMVRYTVRSGDTLWLIARRKQIAIDELARVNHLRPSSTLRPGHTILLPTTNVAETLIQKPAPTPTASHRQRFKGLYYTVRIGDTLSLIAKQFKVSIHDLMAWNSLRGTHRLQVGQTLKITANSPERIAEAGT